LGMVRVCGVDGAEPWTRGQLLYGVTGGKIGGQPDDQPLVDGFQMPDLKIPRSLGSGPVCRGGPISIRIVHACDDIDAANLTPEI